jgi:hypothetical protein
LSCPEGFLFAGCGGDSFNLMISFNFDDTIHTSVANSLLKSHPNDEIF